MAQSKSGPGVAVAAPALDKGVSRRRALQLYAAAGGSPFLGGLAAAGAAAAQSADDFKALVCVFLAGGNDQSNTVIPYETSAYNQYRAARPSLALERTSLLTLSPTGYSGPQLALSPHMPGLRTLFQQRRCAILANVGTLAYPVTRAQYEANSRPLPFQLFSHSDQAGSWQTGVPDSVSRTGWLGRIGDLISGAYNAPGSISIAMSLAGNNTIQAGQSTIQYQVTTEGPIRIQPLDGWGPLWQSELARIRVLEMLTRPRQHTMSRAFCDIYSRAINSEEQLSQALNTAAPITTAFPQTSLGAQLAMVARLISIQSRLGQRRQIYYVAAGGYDFHDNLLTEQAERLSQLDAALTAFYAATVELNVASNVTSFTASDFGRALQHNGRGSDHGWGGHHFIVGGAVRGRRIFGTMPTVALDTDLDAGQGRLIPTTSVDQYAASLASWFGVPSSELGTILPNLSRFSPTTLSLFS